jgi:DNA-binding protein H-NS
MATLKQIQNRIEKLQAQAEGLIAKRTAVVIGEIHALMAKHGLTIADLDAHAPRGRTRGAKAAAGAKTRGAKAAGKLPPKYLNPETGATWSGHARPPAWIKNAKDRSVFLIDQSAADAEAAPASAPKRKRASVAKKAGAAKRAVARKTAAKSAKAPKKAPAAKSGKTASRAKRPTGTARSAAKTAAA